jgi:hypothetical protein
MKLSTAALSELPVSMIAAPRISSATIVKVAGRFPTTARIPSTTAATPTSACIPAEPDANMDRREEPNEYQPITGYGPQRGAALGRSDLADPSFSPRRFDRMQKPKPCSYANPAATVPEPRRRAYRELRRMRIALMSDVALACVGAITIVLLLIGLLMPSGDTDLEGNSASPPAVIGPHAR